MQGRDLLAAAQTGTGKAAAFALPILQALKTTANASFAPARHPVRALILTPTRELAMQIEEATRTHGRHLPLVRLTAVYGGVPIEPQTTALRGGVRSGRHPAGCSTTSASATSTSDGSRSSSSTGRYMLDMGFLPDIQHPRTAAAAAEPALLGTFSDDIRRLSGSLLRDPARVEVAPRNHDRRRVRQIVYRSIATAGQLLAHLIRGARQCHLHAPGRRSPPGHLARPERHPGRGHPQRPQPAGAHGARGLQAGDVIVLVATDVASRRPRHRGPAARRQFRAALRARDYIHRIGRTACRCRSAISLVCV